MRVFHAGVRGPGESSSTAWSLSIQASFHPRWHRRGSCACTNAPPEISHFWNWESAGPVIAHPHPVRKSERRQLVGVSALAATSIALVTILTLRIGDLESSGVPGRQQAAPRSDIDGDSEEVPADTSRALHETDAGGPPSTIDGARKRTQLASDLTWSDLGMDPAHVIEFTGDQQRVPSVDGVSPAPRDEGSAVAVGESRNGLVVTSVDAGAPDANDVAVLDGVDSPNDDQKSGETPSVIPVDAGSADAGDVSATSSLGEPWEELAECGMITCGPGEVCCNASCAICTEPGVYCKSETCDMKFLQTGELCGLQSCSFGSTCCCGTCIAPGQSCDPDDCAITSGLALSEPCGTMTLCGEGEVCCNPSCGTCVQPGDSCSQQVCD